MLDMRVKEYRIGSDSNQVIVEKVRYTESGEVSMLVDKKTGDEYESRSLVGYYQTLPKALVGIQRDYILAGEGVSIHTIQDYQTATLQITKDFMDTIGLIDANNLVTGTLDSAYNSVGTISSGTIKGADVL